MMENFSSCLGALKLIQHGWETEAIPESLNKLAKKKAFWLEFLVTLNKYTLYFLVT